MLKAVYFDGVVSSRSAHAILDISVIIQVALSYFT